MDEEFKVQGYDDGISKGRPGQAFLYFLKSDQLQLPVAWTVAQGFMRLHINGLAESFLQALATSTPNVGVVASNSP